MVDMNSLILGFVLGAVSVIVGSLLPASRRTKRAGDGATWESLGAGNDE